PGRHRRVAAACRFAKNGPRLSPMQARTHDWLTVRCGASHTRHSQHAPSRLGLKWSSPRAAPGSRIVLPAASYRLKIPMKITNARVIITCPGRNFVTLKIETDAGLSGVGDATLNGRELSVASYLTDHVIPTLIGRDAAQIEDIWQYLYRGAYWRRGPVTMSAIAAVDTALWDIKAKQANPAALQPVGRRQPHGHHGLRPRQRRNDRRRDRRSAQVQSHGLSRHPPASGRAGPTLHLRRVEGQNVLRTRRRREPQRE